MRLSEQERSAAQDDLDRLTGELVRLYQLREQLKLALGDGGEAKVVGAGGEVPPDLAEPPAFRLLQGTLHDQPQRDPAQRQALRAQFQVIHGGLS
jgi:hypothetical protein